MSGQTPKGERSKRKKRGIAGGGKAGGDTAEGTPSGKESGGGWGETLRSVAWAIVLFLILRTFILQTFFITSGSMKDTMLVGDFLVVNKVAVGSRIPFTQIRVPGYSERSRGEILVFDPEHEATLTLVKRLVALPGDTVEMRNRVFYLNGEPQDEPYVRHINSPDTFVPEMRWQFDHLAPGVDAATYQPTRDTWGPLVIPEDNYFFLGDNREESRDSRFWGLVEGWRIEGRASFIYFSYDQDSFKPFPFLTTIRWGRILNGYH